MLPFSIGGRDKIRDGECFARMPASGVRGLSPSSGSNLEQGASSTTYIRGRQSVALVVGALEYLSIRYYVELQIGRAHHAIERAVTRCPDEV